MTTPKLKIEYLPTRRLIPYAKNAKVHSDAQVEDIANSIREFGFNNPVLIDEREGIVAGHGRVMAAELLGIDVLPCIRLSHLSERQRRAYIVADNKLAEKSTWNFEILSEEVNALAELDVDLSVLGFDEQEIDAFLKFDIDLLPGTFNSGPILPPAPAAPPADPAPIDRSESLSAYTRKIKAPTYEPKGEKPSIESIVRLDKVDALLGEIERSEIPEDEKTFLRLAAYRHAVFNYEAIADYYAHAAAATQRLFEKSALVIIDFDKAIEGGFVSLAEEIVEQHRTENEN